MGGPWRDADGRVGLVEREAGSRFAAEARRGKGGRDGRPAVRAGAGAAARQGDPRVERAARRSAIERELHGQGLVDAEELRVDPELEDPDGGLAHAFQAAGWRPAPEVNPGTTRILDLARSEDDIWQDVDRKWRQSITKGGRDGTAVVPAGTVSPAWHALPPPGTVVRTLPAGSTPLPAAAL